MQATNPRAPARSNWIEPQCTRACAFPTALLAFQRNPNSTFTKTIFPNPQERAEKVVYWAADPPVWGQALQESPMAARAYEQQINTGVSPVINGKATLYLECPRRTQTRPLYADKGNMTDSVHKVVHYRTCQGNILGPIQTVDLSRECGFD